MGASFPWPQVSHLLFPLVSSPAALPGRSVTYPTGSGLTFSLLSGTCLAAHSSRAVRFPQVGHVMPLNQPNCCHILPSPADIGAPSTSLL